MPLRSPICDYDSRWPAMYEAEQTQILDTVGHAVQEIHHIGSTAIPGAMAKPEIDLLIVVESLAEIPLVNSGMAQLGYDVRGELGIVGRHYYSKDVEGVRTHKAHGCVKLHSNAVWQLAFRDYLRDHPDEVQAYSMLKVSLANSNVHGIGEYLYGKGPYIKGIIEKALSLGYGPAPNISG